MTTLVSRWGGLCRRVVFFCLVVLVIASNSAAQVPASGWKSIDIGATLPGSTTPAGSGFSIRAAGSDIWGRSDEFRFVYQSLAADGVIVARVGKWDYPNGWSKAGLMIRESLSPDSKHAFMFLSGSHGAALHRRDHPHDVTSKVADTAGTAPIWLRLRRQGSTVLASYSNDGTSWTVLASESISLSGTVYVGLAVTSHLSSAYATSEFTNVTVSNGSSVAVVNQPPVVSLASPVSGATFLAPATIALLADASDPDDRVAMVEFYAGTTRIGSDIASPYTATWSSVPAGTYSLTAVARDASGATTVSSDRVITVASVTQSRLALFTASSNHATAVSHYVLDVFVVGSDPSTANPVASMDLGMPAVVNGECSVDITALVTALPPGLYFSTVTAVGTGGSARSAPSNQFSR